MFTDVDPQAYVTCPYNPSHRMLNHRFQWHLVKCRAGNLDMTLKECPFNSTHKIPEPEMRHHMENCPNRMELDQYVYVADNVNRDRFPILPNGNIPDPNEELWDDGEDVPSYVPEDHIKDKPLLRKLDVQSQAVRRGFRLDERQRFNNLEAARRLENGIAAPPAQLKRPQVASAGLSATSRNIHVPDPPVLQKFVRIGKSNGQAAAAGAPADGDNQLDEAAGYSTHVPAKSAKSKAPAPPLSEILKMGKNGPGYDTASSSEPDQENVVQDEQFPALGAVRTNKPRGRGRGGMGSGRGRKF